MSWGGDMRRHGSAAAARRLTRRRGPTITPDGVWICVRADDRSTELIRAAVALAEEHHLRIVLAIAPARDVQRLTAMAVCGCGCVVIPGELLVDRRPALLKHALEQIPPGIPVTWRLTD